MTVNNPPGLVANVTELTSLIQTPVFDASDVMARDRRRMQSYDSYLNSNPGAFVGVSLVDWLVHVQRANIPHVPADLLTSIKRETVMMSEDIPNAEQIEEIKAFYGDLKRVPPKHMLRWDACAPIHIKSQLQRGNTALPAATIEMGDPRAYDILFDYPRKEIPVLSRPWVDHQIIDGFPVEFRVFIEDSRVIGVANYYIQRALPDNEMIHGYISEVKSLSDKLLFAMKAKGAYPWMPNYENGFGMEHRLINATLDFMVSKDGEVLFLEAGPPYGAGAHPCAFMGKAISGVALNGAAD